MSEPTRLLRGLHLVTAFAERDCDLAVKDGRIVWLGEAGGCPLPVEQVDDLTGLVALPGLIDSHVHFREPGGHAHKAGYASESRAAAAGGVTSVLTMPNTVPATDTVEVLAEARACGRASLVDYGFHFGVALDRFEQLLQVRNVPSFKLYLNETTAVETPLCDAGFLSRVLALGHPVTAHAEADTLDWLLSLHADHGTGPLYIVHVSLAREVAVLRAAKSRGQWVRAEATPHHLFLTQQDAQRLGPLGDMRPTLKTAEDVASLWEGIADGTIDTIATDHAPHLLAEKQAEPPPPGVPGVQTMLPLLLDQVARGRLRLRDIARLCSHAPARIFGLWGKAEIRVGADADLVLVDPAAASRIVNDEQLTRPGWTPFDGREVTGEVVRTMSRGRWVYVKGQGCPDGGGGREVICRSPGG